MTCNGVAFVVVFFVLQRSSFDAAVHTVRCELETAKHNTARPRRAKGKTERIR